MTTSFSRVVWTKDTVPADLPDLPPMNSIVSTKADWECVNALTPVDFFHNDDGTDKLCVCENISKDMASAYLWGKNAGRPLDVNNLKVVHQSCILNRHAYYGFFKPSLDEIVYQMPPELKGKKLLLLIEGPNTADDMVHMMKYINERCHVSRMTLFEDDYVKPAITAEQKESDKKRTKPAEEVVEDDEDCCDDYSDHLHSGDDGDVNSVNSE